MSGHVVMTQEQQQDINLVLAETYLQLAVDRLASVGDPKASGTLTHRGLHFHWVLEPKTETKNQNEK